jgi:hypothetical protein
VIHGSSPFSPRGGLVGSLSSQWGRGGFENYMIGSGGAKVSGSYFMVSQMHIASLRIPS